MLSCCTIFISLSLLFMVVDVIVFVIVRSGDKCEIILHSTSHPLNGKCVESFVRSILHTHTHEPTKTKMNWPEIIGTYNDYIPASFYVRYELERFGNFSNLITISKSNTYLLFFPPQFLFSFYHASSSSFCASVHFNSHIASAVIHRIWLIPFGLALCLSFYCLSTALTHITILLPFFSRNVKGKNNK